MTNNEIRIKLELLIREERQKTNEILTFINLALERRVYLDFGHSSMFNWLVEGFGYSNAAAYRRIEAAKLLKAVPEIKAKLEEGQVNLSTLSKAQTVVKAQERLTGQKVKAEEKAQIVNKIENKSVREAERTLFEIFPSAALSVEQERKTTLSDSQVRHHITLSAKGDTNLRRAKEVLSHKFPNGGSAEILEYALEFLLDQKDPLRLDSKGVRSKTEVRRNIIVEAKGGCTFRDPITGRICGSKHQLQIDHIVPKALGGSDAPENLRALCRAHNIHAAESKLGKNIMDKFRRPN